MNDVLIIIEIIVILGGLLAVRHYYAMWEKRPSFLSFLGSGFAVAWQAVALLLGRRTYGSTEERLAGALLLASQLIVALGVTNIVTYLLYPLPDPPPTLLLSRLVSVAIAWLLAAIATGVFVERKSNDKSFQ